MKSNAILIATLLLTFSLVGCLSDDDYIYPSMTVSYGVDCECDQLYVEYNTEDSLVFGYVEVNDGVWYVNDVQFSESESVRELYIYAADEDEDGQSTTLIIMIELLDDRGVERSNFDLFDGVDPDGQLYYFW